MYSTFDSFLKKIGVSDEEVIAYSFEDTKLATAVLLFRVIQVDGRVREAEMRRYREILQDNLGITPDGLALFEKMVQSESENVVTIDTITSIVDRMPIETKRQVVELMRDISVSDNELHEFELNLVARTAELLKITPKSKN